MEEQDETLARDLREAIEAWVKGRRRDVLVRVECTDALGHVQSVTAPISELENVMSLQWPAKGTS